MLDFIMRFFNRDSGSKNLAKERLRLVLVHDRVGISPHILENMRADLIQVISNYMDIDEQALEVSLDSSGSSVALVANIPVKGIKRVTA